MIFILSACLKQVETLYFEDKDMTLFVTKPFKSTHRYKEIELEASMECPGKVICTEKEIKFKIKHWSHCNFSTRTVLLLHLSLSVFFTHLGWFAYDTPLYVTSC